MNDDQTFELIPVRRPAGMVRVQLSKADNGGMKTRAHWLLEGLNAYRSHRAGYCLTPKKAEVFTTLYKAGWQACRRIAAWDKRPVTFSRGDEKEVSLKEALRLTALETTQAGQPAAPAAL